MTNFLRAVSIFHKNSFVNPYIASLRHIGWAFRKIFNLFPCEIQIGDRRLNVQNQAIANRSAALVNAMGRYEPNKIACYQMALSDHNGRVPFRDVAGHPENRVLDDQTTSRLNVIEVVASRGDEFCSQIGLLAPQVMKIDVEGCENHVLTGFSSKLNEIDLILVECWALEKTIDLLCNKSEFCGLYKIDYRRRRFVRANINYEDWLFVNSKALASLQPLMTFE